jgi:hypothetical protein
VFIFRFLCYNKLFVPGRTEGIQYADMLNTYIQKTFLIRSPVRIYTSICGKNTFLVEGITKNVYSLKLAN